MSTSGTRLRIRRAVAIASGVARFGVSTGLVKMLPATGRCCIISARAPEESRGSSRPAFSISSLASTLGPPPAPATATPFPRGRGLAKRNATSTSTISSRLSTRIVFACRHNPSKMATELVKLAV